MNEQPGTPVPMSRRELEEKIVALAWKDDAFRRRFLADPKGQFEQRLGTKLPSSLAISAFEEDADHLHFVIPAKPRSDLTELSDADLEKVAGGIDVGFALISVAVATAALGSASVGVSVNALNDGKTKW